MTTSDVLPWMRQEFWITRRLTDQARFILEDYTRYRCPSATLEHAACSYITALECAIADSH